MNKKTIKFLLLVLVSFFIVLNVKAVLPTPPYNCKYDGLGNIEIVYDEAGTPTITQNEVGTNSTDWFVSIFVNKSSGKLKTSNNLSKLEYKNIGKCPASIYVCLYDYSSHQLGLGGIGGTIINSLIGDSGLYHEEHTIYLFSSASEQNKNKTLAELPNGKTVKGNEIADTAVNTVQAIGDVWDDNYNFGDVTVSAYHTIVGRGDITIQLITNTDLYYEKTKTCETVYYNGSYDSFNLSCPNISVYWDNFSVSLSDYRDKLDKNDATGIAKAMTDVNRNQEVIRNYCNSVLKNSNMDGSGEEDCITSCLKISQQMNNLIENAKISSGTKSQCGISGRIILWISNIVRWVKYLVPVAVIVLGILDFIKAIASENEDEMKKAQKRFITRLIAAALIFIIPFILEFILDKMGFVIEGCGIIDL